MTGDADRPVGGGPMVDYDTAFAAATEGRAFSNGTEWHMWEARWCGRCLRDVDENCPLVMIAFMERTPKEWVRQPDDRYPQDAYRCTEFKSTGG